MNDDNLNSSDNNQTGNPSSVNQSPLPTGLPNFQANSSGVLPQQPASIQPSQSVTPLYEQTPVIPVQTSPQNIPEQVLDPVQSQPPQTQVVSSPPVLPVQTPSQPQSIPQVLDTAQTPISTEPSMSGNPAPPIAGALSSAPLGSYQGKPQEFIDPGQPMSKPSTAPEITYKPYVPEVQSPAVEIPPSNVSSYANTTENVAPSNDYLSTTDQGSYDTLLVDEPISSVSTSINDQMVNPTESITLQQEYVSNGYPPLQKETYPEATVQQTAQTNLPSSGSKFNFKKILVFVMLSFLLILAVLAGVAFFKSSEEDDLGEMSGEVVWWGLEEEEVYKDLIAEYESSHPNTRIKYSQQSTENYRERLTNSIARGEGPDIFEFHNTWVPMFTSDLDILPSQIMSDAEYTETFFPVIVSNMATKNGIVGIPLMYDAITLFVNQDLLASAAASPPTTWDDLRSLAIDLTNKGDSEIIIQSGVALGGTENIDHWQEVISLMMLQNGVDLNKPEGIQAEDVLNYYTSFTNAHKVWNDSLPNSVVAFANGEVAMMFAPTSRTSEIIKGNPNLRFETVILPQVRKDDPDEPDLGYATYWSEGVWNKSEKRALSWDFLKFMSSRDAQLKIYDKRQKINGVGLLPPRSDMSIDYKDSKIFGSLVALASDSRSWYMADRTYDGDTGIDTQLSESYIKAIKSVSSSNSSRDMDEVIKTLNLDINKVLSQYGVVKALPTPVD